MSGQSQQHTSSQPDSAWNQHYMQTPQALWMQQQRQQEQQQQQQQQQRHQYTTVFIQQAQAIWDRMHMAAMGIKMPQTYDEVLSSWHSLQTCLLLRG